MFIGIVSRQSIDKNHFVRFNISRQHFTFFSVFAVVYLYAHLRIVWILRLFNCRIHKHYYTTFVVHAICKWVLHASDLLYFNWFQPNTTCDTYLNAKICVCLCDLHPSWKCCLNVSNNWKLHSCNIFEPIR